MKRTGEGISARRVEVGMKRHGQNIRNDATSVDVPWRTDVWQGLVQGICERAVAPRCTLVTVHPQ